MRICDFCKKATPTYDTYAYIEQGKGQQVELCDSCYKIFNKIKDKYSFLAYQETIEEINKKK